MAWSLYKRYKSGALWLQNDCLRIRSIIEWQWYARKEGCIKAWIQYWQAPRFVLNQSDRPVIFHNLLAWGFLVLTRCNYVSHKASSLKSTDGEIERTREVYICIGTHLESIQRIQARAWISRELVYLIAIQSWRSESKSLLESYQCRACQQ